MQLIVNVDRNWGIGRDGDMLFHIPEDLRFFRRKTVGGAVIMGRGTFQSLPGGRPLKDRLNIVLSRTAPEREDLIVCRDIDEAVTLASSRYPDDKIYVIGGEQIYRQMLPFCDTAYVTKVDADGKADCFAPDLDRDDNWVMTEEIACGEDKGTRYSICRYSREKQETTGQHAS